MNKPQASNATSTAVMPMVAVIPDGFQEISDAQWEEIAPLLILGRGIGRPYADTRRTLNGILYVMQAGCGWRDMPKQYGSYVTCWRRLTRWQAKGIWRHVGQILVKAEQAEMRR